MLEVLLLPSVCKGMSGVYVTDVKCQGNKPETNLWFVRFVKEMLEANLQKRCEMLDKNSVFVRLTDKSLICQSVSNKTPNITF
jgi:hypothetical protein